MKHAEWFSSTEELFDGLGNLECSFIMSLHFDIRLKPDCNAENTLNLNDGKVIEKLMDSSSRE